MFKGFVIGVVVTIIAAAAVTYTVLITGIIPAGADSRPLPLERWAASTSLEASVMKQAPKGPNPVALTDENLIDGIHLFGKHCAICHGTARGKASASPVAKGQNPRPPQLADHGVEDDPEGATFWIIAHGIRWTGMPAWKDALNDKEMWTLTLFLKHMDKLPPAAEQAWREVTNEPRPSSQ